MKIVARKVVSYTGLPGNSLFRAQIVLLENSKEKHQRLSQSGLQIAHLELLAVFFFQNQKTVLQLRVTSSSETC